MVLSSDATSLEGSSTSTRGQRHDHGFLRPSGETTTAYGVRYDVWKGHAGVAKCSLFVIDPEGTIRHRWVTEDALVLPDLDEAVIVLAGLSRA